MFQQATQEKPSPGCSLMAVDLFVLQSRQRTWKFIVVQFGPLSSIMLRDYTQGPS